MSVQFWAGTTSSWLEKGGQEYCERRRLAPLRSGHRGPVIKNAVNVILRHTGPVVAFCSARQVDGGTGAVYALLSD